MYGVSFVMLIVFLAVSITFLVTVFWKWHVDRVGKLLVGKSNRLRWTETTLSLAREIHNDWDNGGTKDLGQKWTCCVL
jgi:hypothetical protein